MLKWNEIKLNKIYCLNSFKMPSNFSTVYYKVNNNMGYYWFSIDLSEKIENTAKKI